MDATCPWEGASSSAAQHNLQLNLIIFAGGPLIDDAVSRCHFSRYYRVFSLKVGWRQKKRSGSLSHLSISLFDCQSCTAVVPWPVWHSHTAVRACMLSIE